MPENKNQSFEEFFKQKTGRYPTGYKPKTASQQLQEMRSQNILKLATSPTHSDSLMYDRLHPGGTSIFDKKGSSKGGTKKNYQEQLDELLKKNLKDIRTIEQQENAMVKEFEQIDGGEFVPKTKITDEGDFGFGIPEQVYKQKHSQEFLKSLQKRKQNLVKNVRTIEVAKQNNLKFEDLKRNNAKIKQRILDIANSSVIDRTSPGGAKKFLEMINPILQKEFGITYEQYRYMELGRQ